MIVNSYLFLLVVVPSLERASVRGKDRGLGWKALEDSMFLDGSGISGKMGLMMLP